MLLSSFSKRQKIPFSSCEYASKMSRRSYCLQKFMTLTFHCGKKVNIGKKCDTLRQKKPYIFLNTVRRVVFFFFYKIVQRHEFYSGIITTRICFIFRNVFFFSVVVDSVQEWKYFLNDTVSIQVSKSSFWSHNRH